MVAQEANSQLNSNDIVKKMNGAQDDVHKSDNVVEARSIEFGSNGYSCEPCLFLTSREVNFKEQIEEKHRKTDQEKT